MWAGWLPGAAGHTGARASLPAHPPDPIPLLRTPHAVQIKLGTLDQPHTENEFVLRSYTRSAKKSKLAAAEEEQQ